MTTSDLQPDAAPVPSSALPPAAAPSGKPGVNAKITGAALAVPAVTILLWITALCFPNLEVPVEVRDSFIALTGLGLGWVIRGTA